MMGGPMLRRMAETKEERAVDAGQAARRMAGYLAPYRKELFFTMVLIVIATAAALAAPLLIGLAIDKFIAEGDILGLTRTMLLLFFTYVVAYFANVGSFYRMSWVGQHTLNSLRADIFNRIQGLSLKFFDTHDAGDLMSRLVNDTDVINQLFSNGLNRIIGDTLTLAGIVVAMLLLDWRLALASFIVLPVMLFATMFFARRARSAYRKTRARIGDVSADLQENISGVREVQAFAREQANQERFRELNAANRDANVGAQAISSAFMPVVDVLSTIATAIVIGFGGFLVIQGQTTIGVVVAFMAYVNRFFMPIRSISQLTMMLQSGLAGAERIFELLDETIEVQDAPDAIVLPPIEGQVDFQNVSFGYKEGEEVLHGISLQARPGETVALVGPTGAGKSSIISLLLRFYDVWDGSVEIDGLDVREVERASMRQQMGIVLQDTFLFSGTVADNIRYGREGAKNEEVEAAAELVNAHEFIRSLPDGYQTEVQERGSNFSQGQRQLIAFARAVLADPRILILDEATSSVDTRTEAQIQQALGRLLEGRTSFVIAHRLSTIRNADKVLVIEDGQIVERGERTDEASAHEQLMEMRGTYYDLYMSQFRRTDEDEGRAPSGPQPTGTTAASEGALNIAPAGV
ncbi:MAG: ABC transporter ATP-binding protein [Chloroflexota bacterium]|nr:ABC transporter ATP-binding protein [Chloroflexota bacterium]